MWSIRTKTKDRKLRGDNPGSKRRFRWMTCSGARSYTHHIQAQDHGLQTAGTCLPARPQSSPSL